MRHSVRILVLLAFILALGLNATRANSQAPEWPDRKGSGQSRLVVFETFMRPG